MLLRLGKEVGETVMFFGCRHKNEDFIYQEELEEAEKKEVLTKLHVAFSRDQEQKVGLSPASSYSFSQLHHISQLFLGWDDCQ